MGGRKSKHSHSHHAVRLGVYLRDWAVVHECKFRRWEKQECAQWGFDPHINYSSNSNYRLQPWALKGHHYLTYVDRSNDEELFASPGRKRLVVVEKSPSGYRWRYVHVPTAYALKGLMEVDDMHHEVSDNERKELYFNNVNVIGSREDTLVIQVVRRTYEVDFLLADQDSGEYRVLSIYRMVVGDSPYLMEAIISPDLSRYILKPSLFFTRKFRRIEVDNSAQVIVVHGSKESCEISELQDTLFIGDAVTRIFAFDPRYQWQRIAIGNNPEGGVNMLCLYDLAKSKVVKEVDSSVGLHTTQNLVYNPDGRFLVSLVVSPCMAKLGLNMVSYAVYDSDTLDVLHRLSFHEECFTPILNPFSIFPIFTAGGQLMAVSLGENQEEDFVPNASVLVVAVPVVLNLKNICRMAIRHWLPESLDVKTLGLPTKLTDYLLYRPCLA